MLTAAFLLGDRIERLDAPVNEFWYAQRGPHEVLRKINKVLQALQEHHDPRAPTVLPANNNRKCSHGTSTMMALADQRETR